MLTKLTVRNFKRFDEVDIDLGNPVVFIGPNNSGKTTALQALSLWDIGIKSWLAKRQGAQSTGKRTGVTINRRDLLALPVPDSNLLWKNLHVRDSRIIDGKKHTQNIRVDIIVEGDSGEKGWRCGLEFDYANNESFYCRPLRDNGDDNGIIPILPEEAGRIQIAYLPPMSGLTAIETRLDPGAINVRLGEGRTAEVLRNLCYRVFTSDEGEEKWDSLCHKMNQLFGVTLDAPLYVPERGEITMSYKDADLKTRLDISSSGRGLQQTLLLLSYLSANPYAVLLLDEPDAHLEILRQRQIYQILSETALQQKSQIIIASHSEIVLNEAAGRDVVVAFVGKPHRIDRKSGSQVTKALKEVSFDQYYQAEQNRWVLYLEGSTDLAILQSFAELLSHPVSEALQRPFVQYITNQPLKGRSHFNALKEACPYLHGYLLCDNMDKQLQDSPYLREHKWKRREIENYFGFPETLRAYAESFGNKETAGPLFDSQDRERTKKAMSESIEAFAPPAALKKKEGKYDDKWWITTKLSDDFLTRVFEEFFRKLELPNRMNKNGFHTLVRYLPIEFLESEVMEVLDSILAVTEKAGMNEKEVLVS